MVATRFIILGYGRSGSTTLKNIFSQHDNIHTYGEVFRTPKGQGGAPVGTQRFRAGMDPVAFLNDVVYADDNEFAKKCIGFKLFFYHARGDRDSYALWPHLIERKDIKIVFLFRRNLFDCYVSQQRAQRSGQFAFAQAMGVTDAYQAPFEIDLQDCRKFMTVRAQAKARLQEIFEAHDCLTIDYETLFAQPQETMADAFRFLGEDPIEVNILDRKLNREPHEEGITNYAEVVRHFRRSLFEDYFTAPELSQADRQAQLDAITATLDTDGDDATDVNGSASEDGDDDNGPGSDDNGPSADDSDGGFSADDGGPDRRGPIARRLAALRRRMT